MSTPVTLRPALAAMFPKLKRFPVQDTKNAESSFDVLQIALPGQRSAVPAVTSTQLSAADK